MSFVHLHCHSEYSLLDGANRIDDLIARAVEFEQPALAITDHGNLHAAWEFQEKARAQGIKPIIGMADLTRLIASHRANIVDTLHNRAYYGVNLGDTVIDITMETRSPEQVAELLQALTAEGYKHSRVL